MCTVTHAILLRQRLGVLERSRKPIAPDAANLQGGYSPGIVLQVILVTLLHTESYNCADLNTFYRVSMSMNVCGLVFLGTNDEHGILRYELACFSALFLLGLVPPSLVSAWMFLNSDRWLAPLCSRLLLVFYLHLLVSPDRIGVKKIKMYEGVIHRR